MIYFLSICWHIIGVAGFTYWWTKDYDFTTNEIPVVIFVGAGGPFTFIVGWLLHGNSPNTRILLRRRGSEKG